MSLMHVLNLVLLTFLFPFALLLDLILFILTNKNDCLNCGLSDIIKKGVYTKLVISKLKNVQNGTRK